MPSELILENNLLLREVHDEADIEHYIDFNTTYNGLKEGLNTGLLLRKFPGARLNNYWLIEHRETGQILATTCLIPWEMQFEGIPLHTAQLEQALCHPDFRRKGLVKILVKHFMQEVQGRGLDLSFIWGIPYYYRQYGYTYAIEGNSYETLAASAIPESQPGSGGEYSFRPAAVSDCQALSDLYRENMLPYALTLKRSSDHWRYLLEDSHFPVEMIEWPHNSQPAGYLSAGSHPDFPGFCVVESSITDERAVLPALQNLKSRTVGEVNIFWPHESPLARTAHSLGSRPVVSGQWLFHIPNLPHFLMKLAPVFQGRLSQSGFSGLTRNITINLFRHAYRLSFEAGKLESVQHLGFVDSSMGADGGDLCIPAEAFVRLVLAYRSLHELRDAWPDIVVKPSTRDLLEALFPKKQSYLCATYAYFGS